MQYKQNFLLSEDSGKLLFIFMGFLSIFIGVIIPKQSFAAYTLIEQYASSASASSQWTSGDWSANQATGAPNTSSCGDIKTAWAPLPKGSDPEWLQANFTTPVNATGLTVYETYNSGFISQIDLIDTSGTYHTIFTGSDNTGCPGEFSLSFEKTSYLVSGVKIYTQHNSWEEIDAVKLSGTYDVETCLTIPSTYPLYSSTMIDLEKSISVNNISVNRATKSPHAAIDINGSFKKNISQTLPSLSPSSFPSNPAIGGEHIHLSSSKTYNSSTDMYFHDVKLRSPGISVSFTGGGPFHIGELKTEQENNVINFAAGTYYLNKFKTKLKNVTINITSSPVIIHINELFLTEEESVTFNSSGNVDDLIVYLHSGAIVEFKKRYVNFTGVIYGPSNVESVIFYEEDITFHGAIIISGGNIETYKERNSFTYTADDQTAVGKIQLDQNCVSSTPDTEASNFNCIETTALDENSAIKKIYTKLVSTNFNLDVVALKNNELIKTKYNKTVKVEIIDQSNGDVLYSDENFEFSLDANARKQLSLHLNNPYSDLFCRVTYTAGVTTTIGESDNFSVRPLSLSVLSNLTNTSSTGLTKAKAGENFILTATAVSGYNGSPQINNTKIQAHAGAVQTGSLSGAFGTANSSGIATGSTFNYSEVGSFQFTAEGVYDDSFTAVDQPDDCTNNFSNTPDSNGKIGCKFGNTTSTDYFGRFTPDHLDVSLNTPAFVPSCGTFTYLGQPVKYITLPIATVTAKNASGNTTQNYTGDYWKINPTDGTYGFTPAYSIASHSLTILEDSAPSVTDNNNGTGTLTFADSSSNILAITKSTITAPFDAEIALSFTLSDTDGIVVANVNGSAQVNPVSFGTTSTGNGINFSNKTHRWGRAILNNIHGSELTPLSIPVITEYFDGTNFIINTADNCSTFSLASNFSISDTADYNCTLATQTSPVSIGSSGTVKASLSNTTLSSGTTQLIISDNTNTANGPGSGNTGYIELTTNLSNLSWLTYDWDANSSHDNCPSARATFGIYEGNSKQIYFREVY